MKIDINTRVFLLVILSCVTCLAKDAGNNISRTLSPTLTNSGDVRYQSAITENAYQLEKFSLIRSNGDPEFRTYMDTESLISFNYSVICDDLSSEYLLTSSQKPTKVLTVPKFSFHISCSNSANGNGVLTSFTEIRNGSYVISGNFDIQLSSGVIGVAFIEFSLAQQSNHENETSVPIVKRHDVVVIRRLRPVDTIFRIVIYIVQILVLTGFGAELDLQVVKETLRKPVAPVIGFCCQYITMPLVS